MMHTTHTDLVQEYGGVRRLRFDWFLAVDINQSSDVYFSGLVHTHTSIFPGACGFDTYQSVHIWDDVMWIYPVRSIWTMYSFRFLLFTVL